MSTTEHNRTTALPSFAAISQDGQDYKPTIPKKWFLIAAGLSVVLLGAAAHFSEEVLPGHASNAGNLATLQPGPPPEVTLTRVANSAQGFGPVVEATLPAERNDGETKVLDLETGRWLTQPGLQRFNDDVGAMKAWIRTKGLNISCRVWPDGTAACVTYNMTVAPVETRCWNESAPGYFRGLPGLAPGQHSPRRLLLLGPGHAETYVFRTDQGTLGILRLVGLSGDKQLVKIRYKLLQARADTM